MPFLLLPILFVLSWAQQKLLLRKKVENQISNFLPAIALIAVTITAALLVWSLQGVNASRSQTTLFNHKEITTEASQLVHAGLIGGLPSPVSRAINHSLVNSTLKLLNGYLVSFSPSFLFYQGDHNAWHNLRSIGLGNLNPGLLIFFLAGIWILIKERRNSASQLTLLYLLLSPTISAMTIDAPITNRLLDFHLAILLTSAVGANYLYVQLFKSDRASLRAIFLGALTLYFGFFILFSLRYFTVYNQVLDPSWNPGVVEMIDRVNYELPNFDRVLISREFELGHTFFAFYTPFEPTDFQTKANWYKDGFIKVSTYRKYFFTDLPHWEALTTDNIAVFFDNQSNRLLVVERGQTSRPVEVIWQHTDWSGKTNWSLWTIDPEMVIEELESLPPTSDRRSTLEYLRSCQLGDCQSQLLVTPNLDLL